MIYFFLLIAALYLCSCQWKPLGEFREDYLGKESTQCVKGLFLGIVFLAHLSAYVPMTAPSEASFLSFVHWLGQLVVAPFLFYSGYGVGASLETKGKVYRKSIPQNRILHTLFQFDLAVGLFLLLQLALGKTFPLRQILTSLVCWDSLGNSNWYIFVILWAYFFTWVGCILARENRFCSTLLTTVLLAGFVLLLGRWKEDYWYNTAMSYAAGLWFGRYKQQMDGVLQKSNLVYCGCTAACWTLLFLVWRHRGNLVCYELASILFALSIVLLTMKLRPRSRILRYCGEHLFSLFILQRLPMIALQSTMAERSIYLNFTLCLVVTAALSWGFDRIVPKIWEVVFDRKKSILRA